MKLAEALARRADLDKAYTQLGNRLRNNARYSEGEAPAEDARELLTEARHVLRDKFELVCRINLTNAVTELADGMTVTAAIAERDRLGAERKLLTEIADAASGEQERHYYGSRRRSELPVHSALPVGDLRKMADATARQFRELDIKIQEAGWVTELL